MKIHHYNSIETLALILKYKTIRFNRLDRVDDMEESMYGSGPTKIKLGQYVFVSCWTKDDLENISLWKMYKRQLASRSAARELKNLIIYEIAPLLCLYSHYEKQYSPLYGCDK